MPQGIFFLIHRSAFTDKSTKLLNPLADQRLISYQINCDKDTQKGQVYVISKRLVFFLFLFSEIGSTFSRNLSVLAL